VGAAGLFRWFTHWPRCYRPAIMVVPQPGVVRAPPGLVWRALDADGVVGAVTAFLLPNDRWFVAFDACRADTYQPLVGAVSENTGSDSYTTVDDADESMLELLGGIGFTVARRESNFLIPTDPQVTGLAGRCRAGRRRRHLGCRRL